jgi:4'-phosphopantetheinyl transferase
MIQIYYSFLNKSLHHKLLEKYLKKNSLEYQNRVLSFLRWEDTQLSLLGRILLMQGMHDLGKEFDSSKLQHNKYNKPFFLDSEVKFNISHSGQMVVCAISEEFELGIDVELIKDINIDNFKNHMTGYEWENIKREEDKLTAFYDYWTKKEAVVKASGRGLSIPLKSFNVVDNEVTIDNSGFVVKELDLHQDYTCNLAIMKNKLAEHQLVDVKDKIHSVHFNLEQSFQKA